MTKEGFEKYRYSYRIGITPVSSDVVNFETDRLHAEEENSQLVEAYIRDKLSEFSAKSLESVYNTKEVDLNTIAVTERTIVFTLYSMQELPALGKSIRLFSQLVLEEEYFKKLLVKNKLFKTFIPVETNGNNERKEIIDVSMVSDTQLVKGLVEILPKPEYAIGTEIRNAVEKMKVLAVESGLIEI